MQGTEQNLLILAKRTNFVPTLWDSMHGKTYYDRSGAVKSTKYVRWHYILDDGEFACGIQPDQMEDPQRVRHNVKNICGKCLIRVRQLGLEEQMEKDRAEAERLLPMIGKVITYENEKY